jgi:hypothetical protein
MYLSIVKLISLTTTAYRCHQWWAKRQETLRRRQWWRSAALTAGAIGCAILGMMLLARVGR